MIGLGLHFGKYFLQSIDLVAEFLFVGLVGGFGHVAAVVVVAAAAVVVVVVVVPVSEEVVSAADSIVPSWAPAEMGRGVSNMGVKRR